MTLDRRRIAGRLERVFIRPHKRTELHSNGNGSSSENVVTYSGLVGAYGNEPVLVMNAEHYARTRSMVRFDLNQSFSMKYLTLSHFITSNVSEDFKGLSPQEYIFLAIWDESMKKKGLAPTIEELKLHYDPGNVSAFCFMPQINQNSQIMVLSSSCYDPTLKQKMAKETSHQYFRSVKRALNNLPNYYQASRLIVIEGEEQLEGIAYEIGKNHIKPIIMEGVQKGSKNSSPNNGLPLDDDIIPQ